MVFVRDFKKLNRPRAKKILFATLAISSIFTIIVSSYQLYKDYSYEVSYLNNELSRVEESTVEPLALSLWSFDEEQVNLLLKGISKNPHIDYAVVVTSEGKTYSSGTRKEGHDYKIKKLDLKYTYKKGSDKIGQLTIGTSHKEIQEKLIKKAALILFSQMWKTFFVSLFVLIVIYREVGKPLDRLVTTIEKTSWNELDNHFSKEDLPQFSEDDEVGKIWNAIRIQNERIRSDIKEKQSLEKKMQEARKMEYLGNLASGVAHDFNNILQGIVSGVQMAQRQYADPEKHQKGLNSALKFANRGRGIVEKILLFCRDSDLEKYSIDLFESLEQTVEILQMTKARTHKVHFVKKSKSRFVNSDPTLLHQIFFNIAGNATDAMADTPGEIWIEVDEVEKFEGNKGPFLKVSIRDTGPGMSKEVMNQVFDPFFTTKKVGEGTGLGLSIVQGLVADHKGYMSVDSKEGEGTVFCVYFPVSDGLSPKKEKVMGTEVVESKGTNLRVVLVDDEVDLVEAVGSNLSEYGFDVMTFSDPRKAREFLNAQGDQIDIVVSDYKMPELNGLELATAVKGVHPALRFILFSGFYSELAERSNMFERILTKPASIESLIKNINTVYAQSATVKAA